MTKRIAVRVVGVLLLALALLPLSSVRGQNTQLPPELSIGMRVDLTTDNPQLALSAAAALKMQWLLQDVRWADIEPSPGQYNWEPLDAVVAAAHPRGLQLIFSISAAPAWARPLSADLRADGPPDDPADFGRFMTQLAERYRGQVAAYEIWPAANTAAAWSTPSGFSVRAYLALLGAGAQAARTIDPSVKIISGGLMPTDDQPNAVDDISYLRLLYAYGLAGQVDAIGVTLRPNDNPPAASPNSPGSSPCNATSNCYFRHYEQIRAVMVEHDDAATPIWITRVGWAGGIHPPATLSEILQAEYTVAAIEQAQTVPYIDLLLIDNFNLSWKPTADPLAVAQSLTRPDQTVRPVFVALAGFQQINQPVLPVPTRPQPISLLPNWQPRLPSNP